MKIFAKKNRNNILGVEIKDDVLYAVGLSKANAGFRLETYVHAIYQSATMEAMVANLKRHLDDVNFKADRIVIGLDYSKIISRVAEMAADLTDDQIMARTKSLASEALNIAPKLQKH